MIPMITRHNWKNSVYVSIVTPPFVLEGATVPSKIEGPTAYFFLATAT